jgi:hypothetical protein
MSESVTDLKSLFPNVNFDTGIHYGCISQHSVDLSTMDDWYDNDAYYDEAKQEIIDGIKSALSDYFDEEYIAEVVEAALDRFNESYQNDEPAYYFEDSEYSAEYSQSLCCWIIKKSPYYTYCKTCSPCVPNAGDLDSPVTPDEYMDGIERGFFHPKLVKAYCLPKEFFDGDKAPYKYFSVE